MNDNIKIGELVCFCLHSRFPELKNKEIKDLEHRFILEMGVVVSEEDSLGYLEIYSQTKEKTITVHREFIKVLTND